MVWTRLCGTVSDTKHRPSLMQWKEERSKEVTSDNPEYNTHMNPARNSTYCVYVGHCQKSMGRWDACRVSGLSAGRYNIQM